MQLKVYGRAALAAAAVLFAGSAARAQVTSNGNFTFQCGVAACTTTGNGYNDNVFALYLAQGGTYSFYATGSQGDQFRFNFYTDASAASPVATTDYFTGANQLAVAGNLNLAAGQYYVGAGGDCQAGSSGCRATLQSWQLASSISAVPEPASMTLLGTGLLGLAGYRRRRRQVEEPS